MTGVRQPAIRRGSLRRALGNRLATAWDILADAVTNFQVNGDTNQAAAISLYAILSMIPLFILTVLAINDLFGAHPEIAREMVRTLRDLYPSFSMNFIAQIGQIDEKRTVLGWVGIVGLIWLSSMIFNAIETALNMIFRSRIIRNYFVSKLMAFAMIPLGWAVGIVSVAVSYAAGIVARHPLLIGEEFFPFSLAQGFFLRYGLPYLVAVAFSTILYRFIPTVRISLASAIIGGAVFSLLMEAAKHSFTWYIAGFTQYNVIYGPLEAVVILLFWAFYTAIILLFCGEIISSYERRHLLLLEEALLRPRRRRRTRSRLFEKFGRIYPRGAYVFREGDQGNHMFYLLSGRIRLEKGREHKIVSEREAGSYFGEMAVLMDAPYAFSALVVEDSRIAAIDGNTLRDLLRQSAEASLHLLREFARRLRELNAFAADLSQSCLRMLVVFQLLHAEGETTCGHLSRKLAVTAEKDPAEIRSVLAGLEREGIVSLKDDLVTAFDPEKAWQAVRAVHTGEAPL